MGVKQEWTEQELADFKRLYADTPMEELIVILHKSKWVIRAMVTTLGLKKSREYMIERIKRNSFEGNQARKNAASGESSSTRKVRSDRLLDVLADQSRAMQRAGHEKLAEVPKEIAKLIRKSGNYKFDFITTHTPGW